MTKTPSTDLIVAGENSSYEVLKMDPNELQELLTENIGTDTLTARDLDRVKVPAGAGTTWEVPTLDGEIATKDITGVIVARTTRRAYWPAKYDGSNDPPSCHSDDGINGVATEESELPGGPCGECPFNEFGSSEDGVSKACKETRQLFVLTADSLLPFVVTVPPGSLANTKAYFLRLLRARLKPTDVVTKITLEKAKSQGGIDYSKVVLTAGDRLDAEASAKLRQYAAALEPAFQAAKVERSDVEA